MDDWDPTYSHFRILSRISVRSSSWEVSLLMGAVVEERWKWMTVECLLCLQADKLHTSHYRNWCSTIHTGLGLFETCFQNQIPIVWTCAVSLISFRISFSSLRQLWYLSHMVDMTFKHIYKMPTWCLYNSKHIAWCYYYYHVYLAL